MSEAILAMSGFLGVLILYLHRNTTKQITGLRGDMTDQGTELRTEIAEQGKDLRQAITDQGKAWLVVLSRRAPLSGFPSSAWCVSTLAPRTVPPERPPPAAPRSPTPSPACLFCV